MIQLDELHPDIWEALKQKKPSAKDMAATEQIVDGQVHRPLTCICVSRDGTFHLMIESTQRSGVALKPISLAGLSTSLLENHLVRHHGRHKLIDIKCSATAHTPAFTSVIREIALQVLRNRVVPSIAVDQTIKKWKSFWGTSISAILTTDEQVGLIGELVFLRLLIDKIGAEDAIESWQGPLGFRHDFDLDSHVVEIKASQRAHHHIINGIEQLHSNHSLSLVSWSAQSVKTGGTSIPDELQRLETYISKAPELYEKFRQRVAAAGYRPEHRDIYINTRFTIDDGRVYAVRGEFPRLVPPMLKRTLSPRVMNVRYELDLEGLAYAEISSWLEKL